MRPEPPYYAVIFTSVRNDSGSGDYEELSERMVALARTMPGYLGHDSVRGADGLGITVSYWRSLEDIARFRAHPDHAHAIRGGQTGFYEWYESVTARVERVSRRGNREDG